MTLGTNERPIIWIRIFPETKRMSHEDWITVQCPPKTWSWENYTLGIQWVFLFSYESITWDLKIKPMCECRCDERLKTNTEEFTRLGYTGLFGGLEHLKMETRLTDEKEKKCHRKQMNPQCDNARGVHCLYFIIIVYCLCCLLWVMWLFLFIMNQ